MTTITEADVEHAALDWLTGLWAADHGHTSLLTHRARTAATTAKWCLERRLRDAMAGLNPAHPSPALAGRPGLAGGARAGHRFPQEPVSLVVVGASTVVRQAHHERALALGTFVLLQVRRGLGCAVACGSLSKDGSSEVHALVRQAHRVDPMLGGVDPTTSANRAE